jgi:hypothetical protein
MRNLNELGQNDPTGILLVLRLCEIECLLDQAGVLEDQLVPDGEIPVIELSERNGELLYTSPRMFEGTFSKAVDYDRRIYRTSNGYIGMGPFSTRRGDVLVITGRNEAPLILRPVEHPVNNTSQLLGDLYVHGIMHGEAMDSCVLQWKYFQVVRTYLPAW